MATRNHVGIANEDNVGDVFVLYWYVMVGGDEVIDAHGCGGKELRLVAAGSLVKMKH